MWLYIADNNSTSICTTVLLDTQKKAETSCYPEKTHDHRLGTMRNRGKKRNVYCSFSVLRPYALVLSVLKEVRKRVLDAFLDAGGNLLGD